MNDLSKAERAQIFEEALRRQASLGGGVERHMLAVQQQFMDRQRALRIISEIEAVRDRMISASQALQTSLDNLRHLLADSDSPSQAIRRWLATVDENESPDGVVDKSETDRV